MAQLAPPGMEAEAFGLYELAGKATLFAGPLAFGLATDIFSSQRAGISSILGFLVIEIIILLPLRDPK